MKQLLLKAGVVVALSLVGYLFSLMRARQAAVAAVAALRHRPPFPHSGEDGGGRPVAAGAIKEEPRLMKYIEPFQKLTHSSISSSIAGFSLSTKLFPNELRCNLRDLDELVRNEFDSDGEQPDSSTNLNPCIFIKMVESKDIEMEREIEELRNMVRTLQEKERKLETQLLEYYGLKEQEEAVKELVNRVKISAVEAKLFSFKIESLEADKRRLEAQLSDYTGIVAELDAARAKIKLLKKKLKSESELAKEEMASLHEKVAKLEENEQAYQQYNENVRESLIRLKDLEDEVADLTGKNLSLVKENLELTKKLMRLKDLEDEAAELTEENLRLVQENLDLTKKVDSTKLLVSTVVENSEANDLLEEANRLRQQNEELMKEMEQLQLDRCADVEELVYLRWINACLRYELRDYQAARGRPIARDLSSRMSPKSMEKAKQLILGYADSDDNTKNQIEFDREYCSSSQGSSLSVTGELDDAFSSTKNSRNHLKPKLFEKIKKIISRKETQGRKRISSSDGASTSSCDFSWRTSASGSPFNNLMGRDSCDSNSSCVSESIVNEQQQNEDYAFTDIKMYNLRPEEAKAAHCKSEGCSGVEGKSVGPHAPEKLELKKFASALKNTSRTLHFHKPAPVSLS